CACCRRVWHRFTDARSRAAVEVAERHAGGRADDAQLSAARKAAARAEFELNMAMAGHPREEFLTHWQGWEAAHAARLAPPPRAPVKALQPAATAVWEPPPSPAGLRELRAQADLVRDIFGNPFRPVQLDQTWITADVTELAHTIYDECAFE